MHKLIKFGAAGLMTSSLHIIIATIGINFMHMNSSVSNGVAFLVSTIFSFQINTRWSFNSDVKRNVLFRYLMVVAIGLLLTVSISELAKNFGLNYLIGIAAVVCVVPIVTFLLHNYWTYNYCK